jgi:hypothetical protein
MRWRHGSGRRNGSDLPASTFDGSDATPSPYTDPDRNWVDLFTVISGSLLDPSRISNRLYQRRLGLVAGLFFLADGVLAYLLGAQWFALCLILIGVATTVAVRFMQLPLLAFWAVLAVVMMVVIPLSLNASRSAATQPPSCQWLSSSEAMSVLGPGTVASASPTSTHCTWSSSRHPSAQHQAATQLSLMITYPTVVPAPGAGDTVVSTVGLRAWTSSGCDSSICTKTLSVVLSSSFLSMSLTSRGADRSAWQRSTAQNTRRLVRLGILVAARVSPPD